MNRTGLRARIDNTFKAIIWACIMVFVVIILVGVYRGW